MSDQTVIWAINSSGQGYVRVEDYEEIKAERDAAVALLCELVDIEGPQPGTAVWADKVLQFLSITREAEL